MFESIIEGVPTYKSFYTVDELKSSSEKLATRHPDKVKIFEIGKSRKGEKIEALRIGKGKRTALLFARARRRTLQLHQTEIRSNQIKREETQGEETVHRSN